MAQSSYVIGCQYCVPDPVDVVISRRVKKVKDGGFVVSDMNGNSLFKARDKSFWHSTRILLDAAGNPLVTLRGKIMSEHSRWNAFRGESTTDKNLIFTVVKKRKMTQCKKKFAVFLSNNTSNEKVCDFMIKGSWSKRSCVIYAGDSSTIVAQMHKKITSKSLLIGKDNFMVTIFPNVDHAFIVSLIVILDAIRADDAAATEAGIEGVIESVAAVITS